MFKCTRCIEVIIPWNFYVFVSYYDLCKELNNVPQKAKNMLSISFERTGSWKYKHMEKHLLWKQKLHD